MPPPSPTLSGTSGEEEEAASSSRLSMGPEGDDDEPQTGSAVSVSSLPKPQASTSPMIRVGIQRIKDPDVELGGLEKG